MTSVTRINVKGKDEIQLWVHSPFQSGLLECGFDQAVSIYIKVKHRAEMAKH